jgi:hypothetical protein
VIVAAAVLALALGARVEAADPPPRTIALKGDQLTVKVEGVPLDDVLQSIVAPSNGEVRGAVKQPREVTIDFEDVPLQDGLTRLLGAQNFVLTYREDGTLRTVTLLGGPLEPSSEARIVKTTPPAAAPLSAVELMQRNVQVPAGSKLAQFLGQPSASLQELLDITLRQNDPSLRQEALRAGVSAIDNQPDLRATVVKSLAETDDHALENVLRSMAQDRAHEIVAQMAATSRTPEIRARGARLLRQLNAPGAAPQ